MVSSKKKEISFVEKVFINAYMEGDYDMWVMDTWLDEMKDDIIAGDSYDNKIAIGSRLKLFSKSRSLGGSIKKKSFYSISSDFYDNNRIFSYYNCNPWNMTLLFWFSSMNVYKNKLMYYKYFVLSRNKFDSSIKKVIDDFYYNSGSEFISKYKKLKYNDSMLYFKFLENYSFDFSKDFYVYMYYFLNAFTSGGDLSYKVSVFFNLSKFVKCRSGSSFLMYMFMVYKLLVPMISLSNQYFGRRNKSMSVPYSEGFKNFFKCHVLSTSWLVVGVSLSKESTLFLSLLHELFDMLKNSGYSYEAKCNFYSEFLNVYKSNLSNFGQYFKSFKYISHKKL